MKKIDFHIHTVPTAKDADFEFDLDVLCKYVHEAELDAVAVTNHDIFDLKQYELISNRLGAVVFPGIEISLVHGQMLILADVNDVDDFDARACKVSEHVAGGSRLAVADVELIFGDLKRYLLIPHYLKKPAVSAETLASLRQYIEAGEVDSPKKFLRALKDPGQLTPLLFSDVRMCAGMDSFPTRQTYVDCGEISLQALKHCLRDRSKVALTRADGNSLWPALGGGLKLSTGLNIVLGDRSSGKTYLLNQLYEATPNTKYIRQFSLVQQDEEAYERDFNRDLQRKRSTETDEYLAGFKRVVEDVMNIDLEGNDRNTERYIETLLSSASQQDRNDAYSKTTLFSESEFSVEQSTTLDELIKSVEQLIENVEFRGLIEQYVQRSALSHLIVELIRHAREKTLEQRKRKWVNELVKDVKRQLGLRTAAMQVEDVDLYRNCMDERRVQRFSEIVRFLKWEKAVKSEDIQGFKVVTRKAPYAGAGEVKAASGVKAAFSDAYRQYDNPYKYLRALLEIDQLGRGEAYRLFSNINCRILNSDGYEVSGGERSEFRLLQEIQDAQNYDLLLIDEPESSFDNLFLLSDVNALVKGIASSMPVVVVTHNNTVGASIGGDFLLYTRKERDGADIVYRVYSGYPTDGALKSTDGREMQTHSALLNSLEAGADAYEQRRVGYEAVKD